MSPNNFFHFPLVHISILIEGHSKSLVPPNLNTKLGFIIYGPIIWFYSNRVELKSVVVTTLA